MIRTSRILLVVMAMTVILVLGIAGPASAGTAYRYWSNGTGGESITIAESSALAWIDDKAKGRYRNDSGVTAWVVLRDHKIVHTNTSTHRPGAYYNVVDPYGYTADIEYTLQEMGHNIGTYNSVYDDNTALGVMGFQMLNGLTQDGNVTTDDYYRVSYATQ